MASFDDLATLGTKLQVAFRVYSDIGQHWTERTKYVLRRDFYKLDAAMRDLRSAYIDMVTEAHKRTIKEGTTKFLWWTPEK